MSNGEQNSAALRVARFGPRPSPVSDRLLRRVYYSTDGCWIKPGAENGRGYSVVKIGSMADGSRRQGLAHRVAYQLFCGDIPDGLCVLHRCDNRRCVNPDHLFLGTAKDNTEDMVAKGRNGRSKEGRWIGGKL